jgi:hypothetical protein
MKKIFLFLLFICCLLVAHAQTKSWKRGVCMSDLRKADFDALHTGMTWFYDWGNTPGNTGISASDAYSIEYCPMRWGSDWNPNAIRSYVQTHPNCKYLLTFNEPNFKEQAHLTPQQAADRWPEIRALAHELGLKVISPALNYSSWTEWGTPKKWLDAFFQLVPIEELDGIALHCYMGWSEALVDYVREYIRYYNKPIWLTEFCAWDDRNGTPDEAMKKIQREYLTDAFDFLETEPMVARYAWFMAKTSENNATPQFPWMQLLNGQNGVLTENGHIFNNLSSYDDTFYHNMQTRMQANHYIRMKGVHWEETDDASGIIHAYDFNNGDYLDYNVDGTADGTCYLFLRYSCYAGGRLALQTEGGNAVIADLELPASETGWATKKYPINLKAGKQKIRLSYTSGNNIRFNWMHITLNENAETEGGYTLTNPSHPVNLALNKPVEASSEQAYGNRKAKFAVDGIIDTQRWATEWEGANPDNDRWFLVDMQTTCNIDRITIYWEAAYATAYDIEVSDDKQHWTRIYQTSGGKGGVEELVTAQGVGRYVRFQCVTRATSYGVSFYEFEVYGTTATGIQSSDEAKIALYPNPAGNRLSIQGINGTKPVRITDVAGKTMMEEATNGTIDISKLETGVYLLFIGQTKMKFVKR